MTYSNLQKALARAGVSEGTGRGNRVKEALEAAKVNKEDLGLQRAINAELEKILQTQREINRTNLAQARIAAKNAEGKSYDQRVAALEQIGASEHGFHPGYTGRIPRKCLVKPYLVGKHPPCILQMVYVRPT